MEIRQNGDFLRQVRTLFHAGAAGNLSDGQLLERYTEGERTIAELAFATLVERHGPMVLRVCRRVLGDPHEAEDAFQATFLVLARRAPSVRRRDSLASWLHGVALRVAGTARKGTVRRRWHEHRFAERTEPVAIDAPIASDLGAILHEELGRLPERFRAPIVLCYLEGHSCEQAAQRLNRPVGTVKSRLARGREALRLRLIRRGLASTAGPLAVALADEGVAAPAPMLLVQSTVRAACALASGKAAMAGTVPAAAAELMEGVLKTMAIIHRKRIAACLLAVGVAAAGAGVLSRSASGDDPAAPPNEASKISMPEYVVEPPDLIVLEVQAPLAALSGKRLVRPDGRIHLGDYGDVYVAGLTPVEIGKKVASHLQARLREDLERGAPGEDVAQRAKPALAGPLRVNVDVDAYNSKVYYVQGNVAAPGRYNITGNDTVLDAVNYAGGVTPSLANPSIRLVRPSPRPQVLTVDWDAIVNRGDPRTNYQLFPGDRLMVFLDPKAESGRAEQGRAPEAGALKRLESRVTELERRLDQVIELLRGLPRPQAAPLQR